MMLGMDCTSSPSSFHSSCNTFLDSSNHGAHSHNGQLAKDHILNMSPTPSHHLNPLALYFNSTLPDQSSICWESEKSPCFSSITSILSHGAPASKSSADLMKEIADLEVEIMHLERYLLSLYRTAFDQHIPTSLKNNGTHSQVKIGTPVQQAIEQLCHKLEPEMWENGTNHHDIISPAHVMAGSDHQIHAATQKSSSRREKKNADLGRHSLADHLGVFIDNAFCSPDRLSEDIVRCISSIYCKLANPSSTHTGFSVSSSSSSSSSSTFSPKNLSGGWSPHGNEEVTGHYQFQGVKAENGPYAATIEVLEICLDDDRFNYAAKKLQNFRSLVKSLEKVDPRKMKREQKLVFWINIHNALVMHAYLAYGTHNYVRSTTALKAAYNVGGQCINPYIIQSSILGIRSHYSAPWLQTLLSPGKKLKTGSSRHAYAIEYAEPLVHFALSSGAYSDPVVRIYTANNVFQELQLAKEEFIRASIHIHKETKIYLPKILCYFAKDMSLTIPELVEMLHGCLSEVQQKAIRRCIKGRADRYIYWLPQGSSFRYLIHRDLAEGNLSS